VHQPLRVGIGAAFFFGLAMDVHQAALLGQHALAYTTLSVKQIALGLGFGDAGYFTRFFQRLSGRTPTQWRGQAYAARA
jgi:rod shape-determining protein MreD